MKLLPPRSAHSYQQESQSNRAGPLHLWGEPAQHSSGTGPAPPSTQHIPHWRADRMGCCDLSHHFPQPLKSYNYHSSLQQHHPSSLKFLGSQCKICEEKRWVKAAGFISPAPEQLKTPRVTHSLFALRKKSFKWLIVMWLHHQGSYHNLKNLKKCRQSKWLKLSLSWGKGEEER